MEEFDLKNIWDRQDEDAGQFFKGIAPEVEKLARQNSKSIVAKALRNSRNEMYLTITLGMFVLFWAEFNSTLFWAFVIGNCIAIPLAVHLYIRLRNKIKAINQASLKLALEAKIEILRGFVKRLNFYTYVILPVGFFLGLFSNIFDRAAYMTWMNIAKDLGLVLLIAIPFLAVLIWFFKEKYIYWLYGKYLTELEQLYHGLKEEE